ncbi:MAG TPA: hypothetical protein VMS86_01580 [Thermoanaerobaculia bacterium]|nr:hypothetical protein [Thermoanaerobaculia bacterium]
MKPAWGIAVAGAVAAATVALELAFRHAAHPVYPWHSMPGFDLACGLAGCWVIVVVSKALGRAGLERPEPHYGDEE